MVLDMASNANNSGTTETAKPAVETVAPAVTTPVAAQPKVETPAAEVAKVVPAPVKVATPAPAKIAKPAVAKPAAKVAKSAPVKAVKPKPVKAAKPAAKLVKKIVSVEPTPIAQGVTKMTDTVKATAEKATEYFADIREKASEAAEKGKKYAADAVEFNKANVEAMIEAAKIAAKGAQDMGKTNVEFAKKNFEEMQAAVKEITAVKSPTDFVKLQGEMARKGFDVAVAQTSKNTEAMVKLVSDMFQPISNRIAVTTDLFKKAA
jgi:phasin family protein